MLKVCLTGHNCVYIYIWTSDVNEYEKKMNISYVLHYKTGVYTRKGSTDVIISSFICANFCHNLKSSMTLTKGLIELIPYIYHNSQ